VLGHAELDALVRAAIDEDADRLIPSADHDDRGLADIAPGEVAGFGDLGA
jgi:hypothetical protein